MGPPRDLTLAMARALGCDTFIETGTYKGKTTRWAAARFRSVHTVERSQPFYARYHGELEALGNVTTHFGDSRSALPAIIESVDGAPAVYWLDSHWMGGVTAGRDDECPLMDELALLCDKPRNIVIIDDARYFLSTPPDFHEARFWPTLFDIAGLYRDMFDQVYVQIFHDNIFIVPRHDATVKILTDEARDFANRLIRQAD